MIKSTRCPNECPEPGEQGLDSTSLYQLLSASQVHTCWCWCWCSSARERQQERESERDGDHDHFWADEHGLASEWVPVWLKKGQNDTHIPGNLFRAGAARLAGLWCVPPSRGMPWKLRQGKGNRRKAIRCCRKRLNAVVLVLLLCLGCAFSYGAVFFSHHSPVLPRCFCLGIFCRLLLLGQRLGCFFWTTTRNHIVFKEYILNVSSRLLNVTVLKSCSLVILIQWPHQKSRQLRSPETLSLRILRKYHRVRLEIQLAGATGVTGNRE